MKIKVKKYYRIMNSQVILMSIMVGVISGAVASINMHVGEYLQLPVVNQDRAGKCMSVSNYKNGEAYQCSDVDTILRNYRVKKT